MAELSRFFNSVNGDRRYLAEEFAKYFSQFLTNGVYHLNLVPQLAVKTIGTDLTVYVEPGNALINGFMYENTTNKTLAIDAADPILNRIDRVVIRMNRNIEARNITAQIVKGIPSANPVAPELTRDNYIYEISLAQIYVTKGAMYIGADNITDERHDITVCGLVHSMITENIPIVTDGVTNKQYAVKINNKVLYLEEV